MAKKEKVKQLPVRDFLMVRLICGATKSGFQTDRKKKQSRNACRRQVKTEEC